MKVFTYQRSGGKDVIYDYIDKLPKSESNKLHKILTSLEMEGMEALKRLDTKPLYGGLYEIRCSDERLMYVLADEDSIYILHACKKQKGKAELFELNKAKKRARELGRELGREFV